MNSGSTHNIPFKITVTKDYRNFKAEEIIDLSIITTLKYITIVGENGCGKSSLFQALRGYKNSAPTKSLYEDDFKQLAENITVEHSYENIFYFDNVKDNGSDFMVAYDAVEFIESGGFHKNRMSHGQGSLYDIAKFVDKHKDRIIPGKTLIVLDEIDNGLSLKNQSIFMNFIGKLMHLGAHVVAITHNVFFIQQSLLCYDMEKRNMVTSTKYLQEVTGYTLIKK